MSFYLDSSVTVAALTAEAATDRVLTWLRKNSFEISDWVFTEVASALSRKHRMGLVSTEHKRQALAQFERQFVAGTQLFTVNRGHFHRAAVLVDQAPIGLRAGDALHLAIAEDNSATLCTLDKRQAEAGAALGVATLLI